MEVSVNWVSVIAAAIANMAIGFAWYSDSLFGKQWRKLTGISEGKPSGDAMAKMMAIGLGSAVIMAYILTYAMVFAGKFLGTSGMQLGVMTGFWNWLGFMVPVLLAGYLYEKKPFALFWINGGYWLVSLVVMGTIIAFWM